MKKFALIATLAFAATAATAAEYSAFTRYDYDNLSNVKNVELHRGTVGAAANFGKFGTVDAGIVGGQLRIGGAHPSDQGVEVGYANGTSFGKIGVVGRVGFGRYNENKLDTLRLSTEVTYPVMKNVTAVAGVEHIRVESEAVANRFMAGADVAVAKNVTARVAVARTNFTGGSEAANGLTVGVSYKF